MKYRQYYESPLGKMILECSESSLTACGFADCERFLEYLEEEGSEQDIAEKDHPVLAKTREWLDAYFSGKDPGELPPIYLSGETARKNILHLTSKVPYGTTTTYGKIAIRLAARIGRGKTSSQDVSGTLSRNPFAVIVPCHRVVGYDGHLVSYVDGLEKKIKLLELEGIDTSGFCE